MPLSHDEREGTGTVPFAQRSQLSGAATERFRIAAGLPSGAIAGLGAGVGARRAMGKNSPRAHPANRSPRGPLTGVLSPRAPARGDLDGSLHWAQDASGPRRAGTRNVRRLVAEVRVCRFR